VLETHLARCPDCRAAYEEAVRARAQWLLTPQFAPPPPPELAAAARAVAEPRARARLRTQVLAAAGLIVVVGGALAVMTMVRRPAGRVPLSPAVQRALETASARGFVYPGAEASAGSAPPVFRSGETPDAEEVAAAARLARERYEAGDRSAPSAFAACASLLAAGQLDAARGIAEERLRDHPRDAPMRMLRAAVAHRESDLDGCQRELREVLRQWPAYATARFDLGWVLAERDSVDAAAREWEALLERHPRGPIADRTLRELGRLRWEPR
jgi:tetratricopeptide (TPR) repeat protein